MSPSSQEPHQPSRYTHTYLAGEVHHTAVPASRPRLLGALGGPASGVSPWVASSEGRTGLVRWSFLSGSTVCGWVSGCRRWQDNNPWEFKNWGLTLSRDSVKKIQPLRQPAVSCPHLGLNHPTCMRSWKLGRAFLIVTMTGGATNVVCLQEFGDYAVR